MGKIRNQGSASLEATLVMSVFLLAMVSLFWMAQSVLAEAQVYEAAAETAEYATAVSAAPRYAISAIYSAVSKVCR